MRHLPVAVLGFLLVVSGSGLLAVPEPAFTVARRDDEEAQERRLIARRAVAENCTICHAIDMIEAQRLTPSQWKTEVEKMVGWGSPLPADLTASVIDFLAAEHPVDARPVSLRKLTVAKAFDLIRPEPSKESPGGDPSKGQALHTKNCANCHGTDGQGAELGPNLVERPVLLRPAEFADVVRKGRGRMPGFSTALDATAEADVLAWLWERRYRTPPTKR